ncbi:MAG: efflux RND transporter periplasmic adaptor subunit [Alsobacter sp.]
MALRDVLTPSPGEIVRLLALAGALAFAGNHAQAQQGGPTPVSVAKPIVKDITEYDEFTGRFEATDFVEVRSRVTGYLDKVSFKDGGFVKQGDLLFTIDPRPYEAAYNKAASAVTVAQSQFDFASNDLERAESLRKTGNISDQTVDQRRQAFLTSEADLAGAKAALESARLDLDFTQIKAPVSGRISRKLVTEGNLVTANSTVLTTIVSLDPIQFYFDVDERSFVAYAKAGLNKSRNLATPVSEVMVAVTGDKEPTRKGRLDFIDNRLDSATGTMRLRAVFDNPDFFLTPGMFGRIRIVGSDVYKGVLVPDEAIASDQDRRVVYVVGDDGSVKPTQVRPGPKQDGYRVIREGLKGDETIVVNGLTRIRPGVKIEPKMTTLPPTREAS